MKKLIIIAGPTASGKSRLAIELAKRIGGEIISADSMQVYRLMDIGTAKLKKEEMGGIRHHLIDIVDPTEDYNVFKYSQDAKAALGEVWSAGRIPIIAGGTGFYIQSVLYDIDFSEEPGDENGNADVILEIPKALRDFFGPSLNEGVSARGLLEEAASVNGAGWLHAVLSSVDPQSAQSIHPNNVKRVIRALEYYMHTGGLISSHNREMRRKSSPYDFRYYCFYRQREELYPLIDKRVDKMMEDGLLKEVKGLVDMGLDDSFVSMQGLGYKQLYRHIKGEVSLEEAVSAIKTETRHFAKRQFTWYRRERDVRMIDFGDYDHDYDRVVRYIGGEL